MKTNLEYDFKVERALEKIKIPPMLIQLLVENAVKHGVAQQLHGGAVNIEVNLKRNMLSILVANPGQLNKHSSFGRKLGVGLANIQERLKLLYAGRASLKVNEKNGWVVAEAKIPIRPSTLSR